MSTALNFKDIIDLPKWRPLAIPLVNIINFYSIISDLRNSEDRHPFIYHNASSTNFQAYNIKNDEWITLGSPALPNAVQATFFMSAQGPRGTIAAGATTTSFTLTTALPAAVGLNQLANRGDGRGFKVRIIGNSAGSSGKTEERLIIANTSGTTPTIVVDSPFSFTPANGDSYEFLSGRVFIIGSTVVAGVWKYYDVLTNSFSGNLATANLTGSTNSINLVGLDELLVPYDRNPGEGFFGILTATATTGGAPPLSTLTGQAVGGDSGIVLNQYRNFQIRIVQDTATPTAVGQRRNITVHSVGPSPIYILSTAWVVTPSATAQYVIENNGDRIISWAAGSTNTSTYTISSNSWDSNGTFATRPVAPGVGMMSQQSFGIEPDTASPPNARQSFIFSFRGGNTATLDLFDIAGSATGLWTSAIVYGNSTITFNNVISSTQDPATNQGRYMYIYPYSSVSPQRTYRFDMKNRVLEQMTYLRPTIDSTNSQSVNALTTTVFIDGNTKLSFLYLKAFPAMFYLPITR